MSGKDTVLPKPSPYLTLFSVLLLVSGTVAAWLPFLMGGLVTNPSSHNSWFSLVIILTVALVPFFTVIAAELWYRPVVFFCYGAIASCPMGAGIFLFGASPPVGVVKPILFYLIGGVAAACAGYLFSPQRLSAKIR